MFGRKRQEEPASEKAGSSPAKVVQKDSPLRIDGSGIRYARTDADAQEVGWDELREVRIVTSAGGAFTTDVRWLLVAEAEDRGAELPGPLVVDDVLARLQRLPDFDNIAMIKAMGSREDAEFTVWTRGS